MEISAGKGVRLAGNGGGNGKETEASDQGKDKPQSDVEGEIAYVS